MQHARTAASAAPHPSFSLPPLPNSSSVSHTQLHPVCSPPPPPPRLSPCLSWALCWLCRHLLHSSSPANLLLLLPPLSFTLRYIPVRSVYICVSHISLEGRPTEVLHWSDLALFVFLLLLKENYNWSVQTNGKNLSLCPPLKSDSEVCSTVRMGFSYVLLFLTCHWWNSSIECVGETQWLQQFRQLINWQWLPKSSCNVLLLCRWW